MTERLPTSLQDITPRQREVARLVSEGLTNEEIATHLGISLAGAKYHVSELLGRLGLERREQVADWYRAHPSTPAQPRVRWQRAAIAFVVTALGTVAVVVLAQGGLPSGGQSADIVDIAPPVPHGEGVTIYRTYTAAELLAMGMDRVGPFLNADAPIEVELRSGATAVRVPRDTYVEPWEFVGTYNIRTPRGDGWLWAHFLLMNARMQGQLLEIVDPDTRHLEFLLVMEDGPWTSDERDRLNVAIDAEGDLFVAPFAWTTPVEYLTGETLDISRAMVTHPVGTAQSDDSVAIYTSCLYATNCTAHYRGWEGYAPISGTVTCTERGFSLSDSDITISFSVSPYPVCLEQAPGTVEAGDPLHVRQPSDRVHIGPIQFWISAAAADGTPLDVAIGSDAALYVGEIPLHVGCPCEVTR